MARPSRVPGQASTQSIKVRATPDEAARLAQIVAAAGYTSRGRYMLDAALRQVKKLPSQYDQQRLTAELYQAQLLEKIAEEISDRSDRLSSDDELQAAYALARLMAEVLAGHLGRHRGKTS